MKDHSKIISVVRMCMLTWMDIHISKDKLDITKGVGYVKCLRTTSRKIVFFDLVMDMYNDEKKPPLPQQ